MRNEIVRFKSAPVFYQKEESGRKPNIVRKLPIGKYRERMLRSLGFGDYGHIVITNSETKKIFTRRVTDVTFWKDCVIISWKHEEIISWKHDD
jgi:hypothetical protein